MNRFCRTVYVLLPGYTGIDQMNFIALDIGSTSIKATAWDLAKLETIGDTIRVPCPAPLPGLPTGHFELDPAAVVSTVQEVITSILSDVADVAGIVSCNQMAGVILADHEGNPLSNYLSWRDQRVFNRSPEAHDPITI